MSGNLTQLPRRVVGIHFTEESLVPVVVLKAAGLQAEHLIAEATRDNLKPVVESKLLTGQLYRIPVDQTVTPDLFPLMAALLAHVVQVDKTLSDKLKGTS